ncbi:hypothetical protein D3C76_1262410 [compost metagenome]
MVITLSSPLLLKPLARPPLILDRRSAVIDSSSLVFSPFFFGQRLTEIIAFADNECAKSKVLFSLATSSTVKLLLFSWTFNFHCAGTSNEISVSSFTFLNSVSPIAVEATTIVITKKNVAARVLQLRAPMTSLRQTSVCVMTV